MAYSFVQYTGNGVTTIYSIPFPYLEQSHIEVRVAGVLQTVTTHYTFPSATQIQFVGAPANGAIVEVRRSSNRAARLVDFQNGAKLTEATLDRDGNQGFYVTQEAFDSVDSRMNVTPENTWNALTRRIINVSAPIGGSDAATKDYADAIALGTLLSPLSVANGGTGGSTTSTARVGLGMADVGKTNTLYNPGFVHLRNPTVSSHNPTAGVPSYVFQRWYTQQVGGSPGDITTDRRTSGGPGEAYSTYARVARSIGATLSFTRLGQVLPTNVSKLFAGRAMTLRFRARAGAAYSATGGALKAIITTSSGTDQSALNCEDGLWTGQADTLSQDVALTGAWQEFSLTTVLPDSTRQVCVRFGATWVGTAVANDYFEITGVQLAISGSADVPLNDLPTELDEYRCLTFFQTRGDGGAASPVLGSGKMNDADTGTVLVNYIPKRIPPTITVSSPGDFWLSTQATNDTVTAFSVVTATIQRDCAIVSVDIGASRTVGDGCHVYGQNTSARLFIDAEF